MPRTTSHMMGGAGHIADMNKRIKYLRSLIKKKRLSENQVFKMPIGKNSKIESKPLSKEDKEKLRLKYAAYYKAERSRKIRIALISLVATGILVWGVVFAFMKLI